MKISMQMIILFALSSMILASCSSALAAQTSQVQSVGGAFGTSWLNKFGHVQTRQESSGSLWNWGTAPKGYMVMNGQLYPEIQPPEIVYPWFMTNTTPVIINGSTTMNYRYYMTQDFLTPDFVNDPWTLAQILERPVIVRYPSKAGLR